MIDRLKAASCSLKFSSTTKKSENLKVKYTRWEYFIGQRDEQCIQGITREYALVYYNYKTTNQDSV